MNRSCVVASLVLVSTLVLAAGCAQAKPQRVPDVRGERLDLAEAKLEARGLSYEVRGGGTLGVIDDSDWLVCDQIPPAGRKTTKVELAVARSCSRSGKSPDVVGLNLHEARETLEAQGLEVNVYPDDEYYGGDGGDDDVVVIERNWQVCEQINRNSTHGRYVQLVVDHECY